MAYRVEASDVDKVFTDRIKNELTFFPKANSYVKNSQAPAPLAAYHRTRTQYILPLRWLLDNCDDIVFPQRPTRDFDPRVLPLNARQQDESDRILTTIKTRRTALLLSRTGGGKTFLFLNAACYIGKRTVILVWIQDHIEQIVNSVKEFTTASVGVVTKDGLDNKDADIIVCLYTRVVKMTQEEIDSVAFLVVDELHLFYNESGFRAIRSFTPERLIGATATFENNNTQLHKAAHPFFGDVFISSAFDVAFDVDVIETDFRGERTRNKRLDYGVDYSKLTKSIMYNPIRNKLIVDLACMYVEEGDKVLIITEEVEHTKQLYEAIGDELRKSSKTCDYLAGKKKTYKDSNVLVGISKRCAVGFDEKAKCPDWNGVRINRVMIVCSVGSSHKLVQICGRSFRSQTPKISHFLDDDPTIERHFDRMLKEVYEPLGGKINYVTISKN